MTYLDGNPFLIIGLSHTPTTIRENTNNLGADSTKVSNLLTQLPNTISSLGL